MTVRSVLLGLATVLAVAGCSSGGGGTPQAAATTTAPAPSGSGDSAGSPTPTPTPNLPAGCDAMLPFTDLDQALGRPLFGATRDIVGVARPLIAPPARPLSPAPRRSALPDRRRSPQAPDMRRGRSAYRSRCGADAGGSRDRP